MKNASASIESRAFEAALEGEGPLSSWEGPR